MKIFRNRSGYQVFKQRGKIYSVHKRVAEKKLGRRVFPGYHVHHINGNKDDNRPSNLTVISARKHRQIHARRRRKGFFRSLFD